MIHIAGVSIRYGTLHRQRCAWCEVVLIDDDLSGMASISSDGAPFEPHAWPVGGLVRVEGNMWSVIPESEHEHKIPPGCCAFKAEPLKLVTQ